jgi:ADP-ribosylglycohydrolase
MNRERVKNKVMGCLLGGLIGDAMGAPVEGWLYQRIAEEKGFIDDFEGAGTDDSLIKLILCEAILESGGYVTADDFAAAFLRHRKDYDWFFIPVRNMFHKLEDGHDLPIHAGYGNMASSSSAMSIAPMGIINACDPRAAAAEAYEVAGLIHSGCCNFCRDGASAVAAAVAQAFRPGVTVASVLDAATAFLHKKSARVMIERVTETLALVKDSADYVDFRKRYYETATLYSVMSDSRETVPVALACFYLSGGDPVRAIAYGANFGRDADTIATMSGAVAGAYAGAEGLRPAWVRKALAHNSRQEELAEEMTGVIEKRCQEKEALLKEIDGL